MTPLAVQGVASEPPSGHGYLDNLPSEVLSEVASYLDFMDIVAVQQTSKKLREAAGARFIWLALAKEYSARHFHLYRPEAGSIDDVETDVLRAWTRKLLIVDHIWRSPRSQPHVRTLDEVGVFATVVRLVPGTRWLLVGYKDGSVCCYDLDLEDPKQIPLIPSSMNVEGIFEKVDALEIYVDQGTSRLEFKLAANRIFDDDDDFGLGHCGWLHVWQVKLEDGNYLAAEWLNSIPYGYGSESALALGPQVLIFTTALCSGPWSSWVELYWWKQCSETRLLRARFYAGTNDLHTVHLIGNDKILCIDRGGIRLFDFPEPEYIDCDIERRIYHWGGIPKRVPIWSLPPLDHMYSFHNASPVWYDGTVYRLILSTTNGVLGLIVPANKGDKPSITKLSNFADQPLSHCLGVCKAYIHIKESGIRIGYSRDGAGGFPVIDYPSEKHEAFSTFHYCSHFDEANGRFVYIGRKGIKAVDFFR